MTALGVAVFVVFVFASVSQVWALSISPNPPIAGQGFTITSGVGISEHIYLFTGATCSGELLDDRVVGPYGSFHVFLPSGNVGPYSVIATTTTRPVTVTEACTAFNIVVTPVPEYPYGLAILAVFMVLGYAVIKRRTRTP